MSHIPGVIEWKRAGENLIRHPGGTYYLHAKVNGRKVRKSLKTTDLKTAKRKRDEELEDLRTTTPTPDAVKTIGEALEAERQRTLSKPKLKKKTIRYYGQLFDKMAATLPCSDPVDRWTIDAARTWWKAHSEAVAAQHANNALQAARRMTRRLVADHLIRDDATAGLKLMRIPKKRLDNLPTVTEMDALIAEIRGNNKRNGQNGKHSEESANMVEWLALTGMRIAELNAIQWEDVGKEWITITGGEDGTKNHEIRQVPISPRLRALIQRIRQPDSAGPVFHIITPRIALRAASGRLGLRRMIVKDLRDWFASQCIEQGVDVVTVAAWLGHKDGGKTLLNTYAHHQKLHGLASAKKLWT